MNDGRVAILLEAADVAAAFTRALEASGFAVRSVTGTLPVAELVRMRVDAVVADPAVISGPVVAWVAELAASLPEAAIVLCADGQTSSGQRVRALRAGADDWVDVAIEPDELAARVEANVRRRARVAPPSLVAELGEATGLTQREHALLDALSAARGRPLGVAELYRAGWGYAMVEGDRSVEIAMARLLGKLADIAPDRVLVAVVGNAWRWAA